MNKIISLDQLPHLLQSLRQHNKRIVLAGGGFDILHRGHITFLERAKAEGDSLIILLESDESLKKKKGPSRPINTKETRAKILAALPSVDSIITLPSIFQDTDYDTVVLRIKPAIIATTKGDPGRKHKERQAVLTGAHVVDVIDRIPDYASSLLAEKISDL